MTATREDIEGWLAKAKRRGARWLIVGLDRFDDENYPIYVMEEDDPWAIIDHIGDNGAGGMGDSWDECYDLRLDIHTQMNEHRARHLPPRPQATSAYQN